MFWENPTLLQNTADWTDKLKGGQLLQRCLGGNFDLWRHFILCGNKLSCHLSGQEVVNARLIKERIVTSALAAAPRKLSKHFHSYQSHYSPQVQKDWDSGVSSHSSSVCVFSLLLSGTWLSSPMFSWLNKEFYMPFKWEYWSWKEQCNANALFSLERKPKQGSPLYPHHPPKNSSSFVMEEAQIRI